MKLEKLAALPFVITAVIFPHSEVGKDGKRGETEHVLKLLEAEDKSSLCPFTEASLEALEVMNTPEGPRIGTRQRIYEILRDGRRFQLHSKRDNQYPHGICIEFDGDPQTLDIDVDECKP